MARGSTYVSRNNGRSETAPMHVVIKDKDVIKYVREYGKHKKWCNEKVVMTCLNSHMTIEELYDSIEREQYELLDEDQKLDVIMKLVRENEALLAKMKDKEEGDEK